MDWMNALQVTLQIYLAVWFAKSMLLLVDVPIAAGVLSRVTGRPISLLLLIMITGILLTMLVTWPKLLMTERWRFFLTYSRFSIIRQVLDACRDARVRSSEEMV